MVQRKGLADLLLALRTLNSSFIQLTLVGRTIIDKSLLSEFKDLPLDIKVNISNEELTKIMHSSDLFVFPSLAEGFAHVLLEAMAVGLPIIATRNTAAPDLIEHGVEGFIIEAKNSNEIARYLEFFLENRNVVELMGRAALRKSKYFTWSNFRDSIIREYLLLK